jgi:hypothetical protein
MDKRKFIDMVFVRSSSETFSTFYLQNDVDDRIAAYVASI